MIYRSLSFNPAAAILADMDGPGKSGGGLAESVVLAAVIGMVGVEFFTNRPTSYVPIASAGRVCAAFNWYRYSGHLFYYTTPGACDLSWGLALVLAIAAMIAASNR
jgi:hypothetical protein